MMKYKVFANEKYFCIAAHSARLVAKAPKWEINAFNFKDHTICTASYDAYVGSYKPDRTIEDLKKKATKCTRAGIPGWLFSYPDNSYALSDGETGLAFRGHLNKKKMARKGFVYAAEDHGIPKEAKEIWRCFLELRTQYGIPLEVYDDFADGERVYRLRSLSQIQGKLDPAMLELPKEYKPGSSVAFEFYSNIVNDAAQLMMP